VSIRPFAKGSLLSDVTERLGMTNAWTEPGDPVYGLGQTDVEGLTRVGDAAFLYIANDGDGGDPFTAVLGDNAVWRSLPFVQKSEVHRLPDGIWMFGGPTSMTQYVDAVVAALNR
jgi:ferric hydroxamate transport system substrate-binding protein